MIAATTESDDDTPGYKRTWLQDNSEGDEEGKQSMVASVVSSPPEQLFTATLLGKFFLTIVIPNEQS